MKRLSSAHVRPSHLNLFGSALLPQVSSQVFLRFSLVVLSLCLSFAGICAPATALNSRSGDVNGDGRVDVTDAVLALQAAARLQALSPEQYAAADVNGSGSVDVSDAVALLRAIVEHGGEVPPPPSSSSLASARFRVDLDTREVSVTPLPSPGDAPTSGGFVKAVFAGGRVSFHSSSVLDEPGNTGRKVLNVSLTNHSNEPMGQLPDGAIPGVRVVLGESGAIKDFRQNTEVSTLAGTGSGGLQNGAASNARFLYPAGVASDGAGAWYVADRGNHVIRKIVDNLVYTLAGNGTPSFSDGSGAAAGFNYPHGIAYNPKDGALVIADAGGHRVRRVTPDGVVTTLAGTGSPGGSNGPGNTATFHSPWGVAADASGAIYVAEHLGHRIRKIVLTGSDSRQASSWSVTTLAGSAAGFQDGVGASARFNRPSGVAADPSGILYVADRNNHAIRRVSPTGEVATIAGDGASGDADGAGAAATFRYPSGIGLVEGAVVVADTYNHSLRQLRLAPGGAPNHAGSWEVLTLAGGNGAGFANGSGDDAKFQFPMGVASDGAAGVVADYANHRIRRMAPKEGFFPVGSLLISTSADPVHLANPDGVMTFSGGSGVEHRPYVTYYGPEGDSSSGLNGTPSGFVVKQSGINAPAPLRPGETTPSLPWVFIVPEGVRAFAFTVRVEADTAYLAPPPAQGGSGSPDVWVSTLAGSDRYGHRDGPIGQAQFDSPSGRMAVDRDGNIFLADSDNQAIRRISRDGVVSTIGGSVGGGAGAVDGPGHLARFRFPEGVAATPDGKALYIADRGNHTFRRMSLTGSDPANPAHWTVSTIAGVAGSSSFNLTSGTNDDVTGEDARFNNPTGIALDSAGDLYVTETSGHRVRRIQFRGGDPSDAQNWYVKIVAGSLSGSTGSDDGTGTNATFDDPRGIAVDRLGNLYVADRDNERIRKITAPASGLGGVVTTFAGSLQGYQDGPGTSARFSAPYDLAVDSAGYLYVADYFNRRIRRISPDGAVTTVAGSGLYGWRDGPGDTAQFEGPTRIAVDSTGNLFVGEAAGGGGPRIRQVQRVLK